MLQKLTNTILLLKLSNKFKVLVFFIFISSLSIAQSEVNEKIRKYIFLAQKQFEKGNESKTYDFVNQAILLKPDSCTLHVIKSDYFFKFQRMALAIESIENSINTFPTCKDLYDQKIFYYQFLGDSLQTIQTIHKALFVFKNDEFALQDLYLKKSNLYLNEKKWEQALFSADSALKINPINPLANRLKGYSMFKLGDQIKGLKLIKSNLKQESLSSDYILYTQCLIENNQLNEAKNILDSLSIQNLESSELSDVWNQLGTIELKKVNLENAESSFQKSIQFNTGNALAYKNLALTYMAKKEYVKVCTNLKKALYLGYTKMYDDEAIKLAEMHCR